MSLYHRLRRLPSLLPLALLLLCPTAPSLAQTKTIAVEPGEFSIENALQEARLARLHGEADKAVISLKAGTYLLSSPVIIRPEDNNTTITADGNVTISGGVRITGWKKDGKLWSAPVPRFNGRPLLFRQLWVNGAKADRARDVADFEQMARIRSVDKKNGIIYVPAKSVKKVAGIDGVEMVLHEMWCVANLRVKSIRIKGDSAAVSFLNPESHVHFMHPWPSPMVTSDGHNSPFYLTNAKVLLDNPGEWWLDEKAERVFYMPRHGENMSRAEVFAPALENVLVISGTPDRPVENVEISGVTFSHASWLRPSLLGHAPLQAGMFMTEAYKIRPQIRRPNGDHGLDNQGWVGRPEAAIKVSCANSVSFKGCTVEHCASTGIDFGTFTSDCLVDGCTVRDCGGNGIMAGSCGGEFHEAHLPFEPFDRRETCKRLTISQNVITDVSNEDWGTVGICALYVRDINIVANEISEVSYTGISLGWGWNQQPSTMANNKVVGNNIHHYAKHMYDTAGIYTLGSQPHSSVEFNAVHDIYSPSYVHDPHHWFYLYTAEGSSGISVKNNWTPVEKYLKNSNGPGNTWENNGPHVADSVRTKAGLNFLK